MFQSPRVVPGHENTPQVSASVSIGHYHFMRLWAKTGKERDVFLEGCAVEEKDTENIRLERTHDHPFQLQGCRGSVRGRSWIAHSWVLEKLGFQVRHQLISVRLFTSFFDTLDLLQGYKECMRAVAWVLLRIHILFPERFLECDGLSPWTKDGGPAGRVRSGARAHPTLAMDPRSTQNRS